MTLTISVDRTSLALGPLVITGSRATATTGANPGLWIPADGYVRPQFAPRRTFAPDSAYVPDKQPVAAVLDEGTWPLTIRAAADDAATLAAVRSVVSYAFSQWRYPVTVTLDDVEETWMCGYTWPTWPESAYWQTRGHEDRAVLTVPVRVP